MAYITSNKDQNWLLPLSIKHMIPKGHICFMVEEFVDSLDFSNFDIIYDGARHPAYHPRIIMKVLIMGMLSRVRISRKLAAGCRENFIMMYLAEKIQPDFRTIARFRKDNAEFVKDAFKKTVEPAIGNVKANLGFREFLLRVLKKVKIELNLACIAHNLQKIWKLRAAKSC